MYKTKNFWTYTEILEVLQIDEKLLDELEAEEIVCPVFRRARPEKFFPASELEKLRLIKTLTDDMAVNLPGVEIILRMRQTMIDMRKQFDAILEQLAQDIQERLEKGPGSLKS
jgi:MerR family transcriptional regulator/heat shock protein HspR